MGVKVLYKGLGYFKTKKTTIALSDPWILQNQANTIYLGAIQISLSGSFSVSYSNNWLKAVTLTPEISHLHWWLILRHSSLDRFCSFSHQHFSETTNFIPSYHLFRLILRRFTLGCIAVSYLLVLRDCPSSYQTISVVYHGVDTHRPTLTPTFSHPCFTEKWGENTGNQCRHIETGLQTQKTGFVLLWLNQKWAQSKCQL